MTSLIFTISYLLLIISCSIFCLGWYAITRSGYVFGFWERFWENISDYKRVYYYDAQLEQRLRFICGANKKLCAKLELSEEKKSLRVKEGQALTPEEIFYIQDTAGWTEIKENIIFLYENVPIYRFPNLFRAPLSGCYVCYASIYGSLYWWLFCTLQTDMFRWTDYPRIAPFLLWPSFCISVAFLNKFWGKRANL